MTRVQLEHLVRAAATISEKRRATITAWIRRDVAAAQRDRRGGGTPT